MINISDFKQLGIMLPNTNKALAQVLGEATHKELESLSQGKDLKTVLSSLLKQSGETPDANKELLQLVKNNPTLKNLGDVSTTLKDLLNALKSDKNPTALEKVLQTFLFEAKDVKNTQLKQKLENSGVFLESRLKNVQNPQLELKQTLSTLLKSLENTNLPNSKAIANEVKAILSAEVFKTAGENLKSLQQLASNVEKLLSNLKNTLPKVLEHFEPKTQAKFSELSNLANKLENFTSPAKLHPQNNVKEIIANDLKAVLLQATEEMAKSKHPNQAEISKQIDKLSLQIDNFQLLSHLSNGTSLYLPYSWDMMEEGKIEMKKSEDEKFYCDIYLKLKEYGEVNLKLTLYDKDQLNLHIYTSNEKFKSLVQENIPLLRSALIETQITPREIRVHEPKTDNANTSPYKQQASDAYNQEMHMGFEVKV